MSRKFLLVFVLLTASASAQHPVEKNVVFGMYSGLALLMDVYRPAKANGAAVICIQGSGWASPMAYDAAATREPRISRVRRCAGSASI